MKTARPIQSRSKRPKTFVEVLAEEAEHVAGEEAEAHAGRVRLLLEDEGVAEVLAEQDADERRADGDHLQARALRATRGENDGGAGDEADPPGDDPDLVVAELDDQAPDDAAHDRGDESRGEGGQEGVRRLRQRVTEGRFPRETNSDSHADPWRGPYSTLRPAGQRVPIGSRSSRGIAAAARAAREGVRPAAAASSEASVPQRTTLPPTKRKGSGGSRRSRRVTSGSIVHSSRTPSASEARICPPSQLGPTPLPE